MRNDRRGTLLAATMMGSGALFASPASAQDNSAVTTFEEEAEGVSEDGGVGDYEPAGNMIVVTARRRAETLQEVPTTVAVTTSETIDRLGLDDLSDIAETTPGLVFDDSFGRDGNRPVIRGQANILGDSGVAFFIDGIYFTGSLADYDVDTIERIEVVKGPQSALYGRNTYSGAINIISKAPGDVWEGRVQADIAEHDFYEITAGVRGPITDALSLGLNGRYYEFGGEFINQFDGEEIGEEQSYSASAILRYDDGGPFRAQLRGYFNRTDDGQPAIFAQGTEANNCFFDRGALYGGGGRYFCGTIRPGEVNTDFARQFANPEDVGLEFDTYNVSLRLEADLTDQLQLISLTGYNNREGTTRTDGDYSPTSFQTAVFARFPAGAPVGFGAAGPLFPFGFVGTTVDFSFANRSEVEDYSQELRLQYESDFFDAILGGYYFRQNNDNFGIRTVPDDAPARAGQSFGIAFGNELALCGANPNCARVAPFFGPSTPNARDENLLDIENRAIFGAVTFHITDKFDIGIEGRYSEEEIEQVAFDFDEGDPRGDAVAEVSETFKEFTPRILASYEATPSNLLYAIYAEGQKPGGFNGPLAIAAGAPTFDAEDNKSYEIGSKNSFLDGTLVFNAAGFFTEIEGYQLTQNISVPPNQVSTVVNAGDAEIIGLELELLARPSRNFTVTANYALADTEFTSGFDENQGVLNDVADDGLVNCSTGDEFPDVGGCQSAFGSIEGRRIPRAPVHRVFADVGYQVPLGSSDWELFAGANVTLTSTSFAQVHNQAETGDSTVVDLRAGFASDRFKVQAYVDNVTDEDAVQQIIRYADANANFRRSFIAGLRPGRRFGVILTAGF